MFSVRRPDREAIEGYRIAGVGLQPTCPPGSIPEGFSHDVIRRQIGVGERDFDRAREGVRQWVAHRAAGVDVSPPQAPLTADSTIALVTRQLGVWVLASCRIVDVVDEQRRFGFIYATLPGHPECGWESFFVDRDESEVRFSIEAVSKPSAPIVRLGSPIARRLQKRVTVRYIDGMERWTRRHT